MVQMWSSEVGAQQKDNRCGADVSAGRADGHVVGERFGALRREVEVEYSPWPEMQREEGPKVQGGPA